MTKALRRTPPSHVALRNLSGAVLVPGKQAIRTGQTVIQGTWRGTRVTKFGYLDNSGHDQEGARAQQKAEALRALKSILPASEYEAMAAQIQSGEREVRVENGFVIICFSPRG